MTLYKKKDGWYLEIKNLVSGEKREDTPTEYKDFLNRPIADSYLKDSTKVTTKALKAAAEDGIFHKYKNYQYIVVHLNLYKNGSIVGRYVMDYNELPNELLGHFKGWKYYSINQKGNAELFDPSYSVLKTFVAPIVFSIILVIFGIISVLWPIAASKANVGLIAFYIMLTYGFILIISKDLTKSYFIKNSTTKLIFASFFFELPYLLSSALTIQKFSFKGNNFSWSFFSTYYLAVLLFVILKLLFSILFDREKMKI
ncbi:MULTISPECIES: hypothetical protein [Bacillus cereus group]|uniref:hypothetical protein n=1 Tax=Bacillus cereus group TaxID=86661 RepID=UPI000BFDE478|nr:hypothetical protein [Bacillus cereus]PGU46927.1 hypothetical protein COD91_06920 [Bacillus cereus]